MPPFGQVHDGNNYFVNDRKMGYKDYGLLKIYKCDNIPNIKIKTKIFS
jgi:hypothetical protein